MRYYIDCEFDGHNGPLLSMALVREDGRSIHIRTTNEASDPWVVDNVMPLMGRHSATIDAHVIESLVGGELREFVAEDQKPLIIADSPVDISRFCSAFMTGADCGYLPNNLPIMKFEVHDVDCYPTLLSGAVQHNAWWDAMALRDRLDA